VNESFRGVAVEVFVVGLRVVAGRVDDAVELQFPGRIRRMRTSFNGLAFGVLSFAFLPAGGPVP
jgi:hypothetical protein